MKITPHKLVNNDTVINCLAQSLVVIFEEKNTQKISVNEKKMDVHLNIKQKIVEYWVKCKAVSEEGGVHNITCLC